MSRLALLLLAGCSAALGQRLADPAELPQALDVLSRDPTQDTLRCQITPVRPRLNFSLRLQAGYLIQVPVDQFSSPPRALKAVAEIAPLAANQKPVYLASRFDLPVLPSNNAKAEMKGDYLLGEGRYNARVIVYDETGRACRAEWPVAAAASGAGLRPAIPPNTVCELRWAGAGGTAEPVLDRLTVLLHAAPFDPNLSQVTAEESATLLGALEGLLDQIPARSVRLVAFNLDQQKELLARDGFTAAGLDELEAALSKQELAVVNYRTLQNRSGPAEFLANIVNREMRAEKPAEEIVFFGPALRTGWNLPKGTVRPQVAVPAYYFQFYRGLRVVDSGGPGRSHGRGRYADQDNLATPWSRDRPQTDGIPSTPGADPIASAVAQLKGRVIPISTAEEFAHAVQRIAHRRAGR